MPLNTLPSEPPGRPLKILTWHVHGNYLYYLTQVPHTFYVLADAARSPGYAGRAGRLPWGDNVIELPVEKARETAFDCLLFQSRSAFEKDQYELLTEAQRRLPRIYLEHNTPLEHPCETRHFVDDVNILLVHVTHFNRLFWDNGRTPTRVIEHGVMVPEHVRYSGSLPRGIAVVNNLARRGRRTGADVLVEARRKVPLDLVGMNAVEAGGLGEVPNNELPAFLSNYRFYFHPNRWTSLGLAAIEAMMVGLPVIGLATTELVTVIRNGCNGYLDTDLDRLTQHAQRLIKNPREARELGAAARMEALDRFHIQRFVADWLAVLREVAQ